MPGWAYSWLGVLPVAVVPSPKSHAWSDTVPSPSVDAVASNSQARKVQSTSKPAVGATLGRTTDTRWVVEEVSPPSSVTVSVTS